MSDWPWPLLALMLGTATAATSNASATAKPHVIFALIDDWGSCEDPDWTRTPGHSNATF